MPQLYLVYESILIVVSQRSKVWNTLSGTQYHHEAFKANGHNHFICLMSSKAQSVPLSEAMAVNVIGALLMVLWSCCALKIAVV